MKLIEACRSLLLLVPIVFASATSTPATAFEELTPAQSLIYNHPHLEATEPQQTIRYRYRDEGVVPAPVDDSATLTVQATHDNGARDVSLEFLSEERAMNLPVFNGYRGNPVIIAMLEHIAVTMSRHTGGGPLYFRNRIRDGLASRDLGILEEPIRTLSGKMIDSQVVRFKPFLNDGYLGSRADYANATFMIALSDGVAGQVASVGVESVVDGKMVYRMTLTVDE